MCPSYEIADVASQTAATVRQTLGLARLVLMEGKRPPPISLTSLLSQSAPSILHVHLKLSLVNADSGLSVLCIMRPLSGGLVDWASALGSETQVLGSVEMHLLARG